MQIPATRLVSLRGKKTRKIVEVGLIDIEFVGTELTYTQTAFYHPFRITWSRKSAERQELLCQQTLPLGRRYELRMSSADSLANLATSRKCISRELERCE